MPERRSNKARARINARERSRERNTCLCPSVDMLKESGPRGGIATVDTYSFPSETDRGGASSIGDDDLYQVIEID